MNENDDVREQAKAIIRKVFGAHIPDVTNGPDLSLANEIAAALTRAATPMEGALRAEIRTMMRAVCGPCNHDVPMNSFNYHQTGDPCEAVRYREVLRAMDRLAPSSVPAEE